MCSLHILDILKHHALALQQGHSFSYLSLSCLQAGTMYASPSIDQQCFCCALSAFKGDSGEQFFWALLCSRRLCSSEGNGPDLTYPHCCILETRLTAKSGAWHSQREIQKADHLVSPLLGSVPGFSSYALQGILCCRLMMADMGISSKKTSWVMCACGAWLGCIVRSDSWRAGFARLVPLPQLIPCCAHVSSVSRTLKAAAARAGS